VWPEGSRSRPLSDNVAGARAIGKTLSHLHRLKRRALRGEACPARTPGPLPIGSFLPSRRAPCAAARVAGFLGRAPFRRGLDFATCEGHYPLQLPGAHVRSHPRVSALEPEGECAKVTGEVRWGHSARALRVNRGENALSGRRHGVTPGHECTCNSRPSQQEPSNNCSRRNSLQDMGLGRFVDGLVGHLEGPLRRRSHTRFSA